MVVVSVINNNMISLYTIIGYDINTPLMTVYDIMTLCKYRMTSAVLFPFPTDIMASFASVRLIRDDYLNNRMVLTLS